MPDENMSVSGLDVVHVPDYSLEQGPDGNKQRIELPGHYLIGVYVNGAFVELAKIGAGRLQKRVDQAASDAQQAQSSQTGPTVQPQQTGDGGTQPAPDQ